ncbi:uncharacterized protein SPPG_06521 [Spizellomyces punctatus DAOM BR117]|uniref:Uncharacterized protein n=1 Tax=Spizellomyces punctatus (strain DAOM BR117) TaxID=645134 RepID=A0A0L0HAD4_SPIPD|nr:uncharacterized protein SPPG_06521 [Spizellomyces punctatus DAOM BR117]KNC98112.1 hypothetical protein SPPG_06521 [Spizellomyces punctatus DAOM BR117]|eukprot:XP_016606152.1 hypothetical protein SPPG_06521 [Spizellomyces punctatus DAOM BR117]
MKVIVETSVLSNDTPTEPASQSDLRSNYPGNLFCWNISPPSPADLVGDKQRHQQQETQKGDPGGGSSSGERDVMVTTTLGEKHVRREGKRRRSRDGPPESTNMHCCKASHWLCYRLHYGKPKPEEIKPNRAKKSVRRAQSVGGVEQRQGQKRRRTQSDRVDISCQLQRDKTPVLQETSDRVNTSPRNPSSRTPLGKRNNTRSPTPPLQRPVIVPRRRNIKRIAKFFAPTNSGAFILDEDAEDRGLDFSGDTEDANRGSRTWHLTIPDMQARPSIPLTHGDTQALFEGEDSPQLVSNDDPMDMTVAVEDSHAELNNVSPYTAGYAQLRPFIRERFINYVIDLSESEEEDVNEPAREPNHRALKMKTATEMEAVRKRMEELEQQKEALQNKMRLIAAKKRKAEAKGPLQAPVTDVTSSAGNMSGAEFPVRNQTSTPATAGSKAVVSSSTISAAPVVAAESTTTGEELSTLVSAAREKDAAEEKVREGTQKAVLPKLAPATRSESPLHEAQPRPDVNDIRIEGAASMAFGQYHTHNDTVGLRGADEDAVASLGVIENLPENAPQYAKGPFGAYPEPILAVEAAEVGVTAEVAGELIISSKARAIRCGNNNVLPKSRNTAISRYSGEEASLIDTTPKQGTHDLLASLPVSQSASTVQVRQRTTPGNIKPARCSRTNSPLTASSSTVSKPRPIRRQRDVFDFPGSQEDDEDRVFTLESEGDKDFTEKKPSPRVFKTYRSPKRTVPVSHVTSAATPSGYHCNVKTPPSKGRRQPNSPLQPALTATSTSFIDVTPEAGSKDRDLRRQDSLIYLFDSPIRGFTVSADGSPLQTNQVESLTQNFDVDANMLEIEKFLENDVDLFKDVRSELEVSEAENGESEED